MYGPHLKFKLSLILNIPLILIFSGGALILSYKELYFHLFCYSFFSLNVILIANAFLGGVLSKIARVEKNHWEQLNHLNLTSQMLKDEMHNIKLNSPSLPETHSLDKAYIITKNLLLTNLESIEEKSYDLKSQLFTVKELGSICFEIKEGVQQINKLTFATQSLQDSAFLRLATLSDKLKDQTERLRNDYTAPHLSLSDHDSIVAEGPPVLRKVMSSAAKKSA